MLCTAFVINMFIVLALTTAVRASNVDSSNCKASTSVHDINAIFTVEFCLALAVSVLSLQFYRPVAYLHNKASTKTGMK